MKFNSELLRYFNARSGAYSHVTKTENGDSQITLDRDEKDVVAEYFGLEHIHIGKKELNPQAALKEFRRHSDGIKISLNLVFPKPKKNELRLYLSERFKPVGEEIWFIYEDENANNLYVGSMASDKWESLREFIQSTSDTRSTKLSFWYKGFDEAPNDDPEELQCWARKVRRGQPKFRANLLEAYGNRCSVMGHGPEEVLEAVHIIPHAQSGVNELDNGLLLRSDLHHLFDSHILGIDPQTFVIRLKNPLLEIKQYQSMDNRPLRTRLDGTHPSVKYLSERWRMFNDAS